MLSPVFKKKIGLFLLFFSIYALLSSGHIDVSDHLQRYVLAEKFLKTGTLNPTELGHKLAPLQILFIAPLAYVGKNFGVSFLNCFFGAGVALLFYLTLTLLLNHFPPRKALALTLALGFGTLLLPYSKALWDGIEECFFVLLGFYFLVQYSKKKSFKWVSFLIASCVLAFLTRFSSFLASSIMLTAVFLISTKKHKIYLSTFLALCIVGGLSINKHFYGSVLGPFYNLNEVFSFTGGLFKHPLLLGLFGLYLTPGKGLFVFTPLALLGLWSFKSFYKKERFLCLVSMALIAAYSLFYAKVTFWTGDYCWGPRYLTVLIPFFILPIAFWWNSRSRIKCGMTFVLAFLGFLINLPAILIVDYHIKYSHWIDLKIPKDIHEKPTTEALQVYSKFENSPIFLQWKNVFQVLKRSQNYQLTPSALAHLSRALSEVNNSKYTLDFYKTFREYSPRSNLFHFWWVYNWHFNSTQDIYLSRKVTIQILSVLFILLLFSIYLLVGKKKVGGGIPPPLTLYLKRPGKNHQRY